MSHNKFKKSITTSAALLILAGVAAPLAASADTKDQGTVFVSNNQRLLGSASLNAMNISFAKPLSSQQSQEKQLSTTETSQQSVTESTTAATKAETNTSAESTKASTSDAAKEADSATTTSSVDQSTTETTDRTAASDEMDKAVKAGTVAEVSTQEEFLAAFNDEAVSQIMLMNDISLTGITTLELDRSLKITGDHGATVLDMGNRQFRLAATTDELVFAMQNIALKRSTAGQAFVVSDTEGQGGNWTFDVESLSKAENSQDGSYATIPKGKVVFSAGTTTLKTTNTARAPGSFFTAKEVVVENHAVVNLSQNGLSSVISSEEPNTHFLVTDGAQVNFESRPSGSSQVPDVISFSGNNSKVTIENAGHLSMAIDGGNSSSKNLINLSGENGQLQLDNATLEGTNSNGGGIHLNGKQAAAAITDSEVTLQTGNVAMAFSGDQSAATVANSKLDMTSSGGSSSLTMTGHAPQFTLTQESVLTFHNPKVMSNPTVYLNGAQSQFTLDQKAKMTASVESANSADTVLTNNIVYLKGEKSTFAMSNQARADLVVTSGKMRGLRIEGDHSTLSLSKGANLNLNTENASALHMVGSYGSLIAENKDTRLTVDSNITGDRDGQSSVIIGGEWFDSEVKNPYYEPLIDISDEAKVTVKANKSSAMAMQGYKGVFNITSNAVLDLSSAATAQLAGDNANATLRFRRPVPLNNPEYYDKQGDYLFNIDGGDFTIKKSAGTVGSSNGSQGAPAVRMWGSNNKIEVQNAGHFYVENAGTGTASDGNMAGGNQGISYFGGGDNSFEVKDAGSEVRIYADYGPAIDMSTQSFSSVGDVNFGSGQVAATNLGYFEARGRTASSNAGIFNTGVTKITFDNPLFMDYRNDRPGGGNIFRNAADSTLDAQDSDLALWKKGDDLDGDPYMRYSNRDYQFSGANLNNLVSMAPDDDFDYDAFGEQGLTAYARLSSNNARWAILSELNVPTNADKKIYGEVEMPVGVNDHRPAWEDEVEVEVEVLRDKKPIKTYKAKTHGNTTDKPGLSIYGQEARGGLFEIELDDFLQAGDEIHVKDLEVLSGPIQDGFENVYVTNDVITFPIVPPTPAEFSSLFIQKDTQSIQGTSKNPNVEVTATLNGEAIDESRISMEENGKFTISLASLGLKVDDKIQVFLRDHEGSAKDADVVNPPTTNNTVGNINPASPLDFHDATFAKATILTVVEEAPGMLSLDQATNWDFGCQVASTNEQSYYALPVSTQDEAKANFVAFTDQRDDDDQTDWTLVVTQEKQFATADGEELTGATLSWQNGQVLSSSGQFGNEENLGKVTDSGLLDPGVAYPLIHFNGQSTNDTWRYCFGDEQTQDKSIQLMVPGSARPQAKGYKTTLNYSLVAGYENSIE